MRDQHPNSPGVRDRTESGQVTTGVFRLGRQQAGPPGIAVAAGIVDIPGPAQADAFLPV